MADPEERGFTVVDRRAGARSEQEAEPERPAAVEGDPPHADFSTFCVSLATSALYHLGLVADPEGRRVEKPDLRLARQTIDTLEMLSAKTQGNLEESEHKLLEEVLYELRMRYVEVRSAGTGRASE